MFYSHTFLARKGPLGTVWCAAHLQHKLKKSHYTSTNIPSTVERIMYPEVPIALRMSGHLLLGVVRIYSKQVDYLFEDCNVVRITINRVFTTVNVNLPEDASHASYHSVTLPETFDLDAINLDDYYNDWQEDAHVMNLNDITLTEQIPTGKDQYIVISINEDDFRAPPSAQDVLRTRAVSMEEDVPPVQVNMDVGFEDLSHCSNLAFDERITGTRTPQEFSSIEIMRDANHGSQFIISPILPNRIDPDKFLEEQIIKDDKTCTPAREEGILSDGQFPSFHEHKKHHSFDHIDSSINFVHRSPELRIQATPPVVDKIVGRRKRKQFYDESTVLSNRHMKNALDDTSGIRRVKRNCPCTLLDIWKVNNRLKKNDLLFQPLRSGLCSDLQDIHREDFITSKPHLITTEKAHDERNVAQFILPRHEDENNMEIEHLRNKDCASPDAYMPSPSTLMPPPGGVCSTPENFDHEMPSGHLETTEGFGTFATTGVGLSSGNLDSEMRTPETFDIEGSNYVNQGLSDIPELVTSAGELAFLEQDDIFSSGSPGTPDFEYLSMNQKTPESQAMSSRTRAVAQYLKKQSSVKPMSGNLEATSGDLSLKKILEGKSRKICARMFSETLVLKNNGLLDVNQVVPYEDITLKVTSNMSKEPFSG